MKRILATVATLLITVPPAGANDAAVERMLFVVSGLMRAAGYPSVAGGIEQGQLRQSIVEYAFDVCQARAQGETDGSIYRTRARAFSNSTAAGQQDLWLLQSVMTAADEQYCAAIGADQYQP